MRGTCLQPDERTGQSARAQREIESEGGGGGGKGGGERERERAILWMVTLYHRETGRRLYYRLRFAT